MGYIRRIASITTSLRSCMNKIDGIETLSRGSGILINKDFYSNNINEFFLLTCSHVACPWLYPNYYKSQWLWLKNITEYDIQHDLEIRQDTTGDILFKIPLYNVILHPTRDICALYGKIDEQYIKLQQEKYNIEIRTAKLSTEILTSGQELFFDGHIQKGIENDRNKTNNDTNVQKSNTIDIQTSLQIPKEIIGKFFLETGAGQSFAHTNEILSDGMCGGAVTTTDGSCVGLIEGIVPLQNGKKENNPLIHIESSASFIPCSIIDEFINNIRENPEQYEKLLIASSFVKSKHN